MIHRMDEISKTAIRSTIDTTFVVWQVLSFDPFASVGWNFNLNTLWHFIAFEIVCKSECNLDYVICGRRTMQKKKLIYSDVECRVWWTAKQQKKENPSHSNPLQQNALDSVFSKFCSTCVAFAADFSNLICYRYLHTMFLLIFRLEDWNNFYLLTPKSSLH